jgi:lipopolysaccharide transport system ATP-binding protein
MTFAIRAAHVTKTYPRRAGAGAHMTYKTAREDLMRLARSPWRALRGARADRTAFTALDDVSFEARPGDVIGVIGRNGAGKSTLLKILSRITRPTSGRVRWHGRIGSLLEVGTGFHQELTGRENIFLAGAVLGMRRAEVRAKFDAIVDFAEVEDALDMPVKRYSSGMFVRLGFAVAAHLDPEILLVDEVLAVGDAAFRAKCLGKMSDAGYQGRTVLFVSHSMGAVVRLCGSAILLERGRVACRGPVAEVVEQYERGFSSGPDEDSQREAHVLYEAGAPVGVEEQEFVVTKLSVLDLEGRPKPVVGTWDDLVLRVEFRARRPVRNGAVTLELAVQHGANLLRIANQPDSGHSLSFVAGENVVECVMRRLPLSAGTYAIGVLLSAPKVEWLWHEPDLARLTVATRDVYSSGQAPSLPRTALAIEHSWRQG